jgi:hypothetical protein
VLNYSEASDYPDNLAVEKAVKNWIFLTGQLSGLLVAHPFSPIGDHSVFEVLCLTK